MLDIVKLKVSTLANQNTSEEIAKINENDDFDKVSACNKQSENDIKHGNTLLDISNRHKCAVNDEDTNKRILCRCQCHNKRTAQRDGKVFPNSQPKYNNGNTKHNTNDIAGCESISNISGTFHINLTSNSILSSTGLEIRTSDINSTKVQTERTKCKTRWKTSSEHYITEIQNQSRCDKWNQVIIRKQNMLRILCHCLLILTVCLFGSVLMINHSKDKTNSGHLHNSPSTDQHSEDIYNFGLIMNKEFKSVSQEEFEKHFTRSKSAADMLKIFFDDPDLSDDEVNSIMYMKSNQYLYGSSRSQRHHMRHDIQSDAQMNDQQHRAEAFKNAQEMSMNPFNTCAEPQPELERIETVHTNSIRTYTPTCTVVHRCKDQTGCCPSGFKCEPKKYGGIQVFHKYFYVFETTADGKMKPADPMVEARAFINHTACECQPIEINSNCHKSCPYQYTKERHGADCKCVCGHGNKECRNMYRGLHPLDEKDLECIKVDECILPQCHTGQFKINTGFCPHFIRRNYRKRS